MAAAVLHAWEHFSLPEACAGAQRAACEGPVTATREWVPAFRKGLGRHRRARAVTATRDDDSCHASRHVPAG